MRAWEVNVINRRFSGGGGERRRTMSELSKDLELSLSGTPEWIDFLGPGLTLSASGAKVPNGSFASPPTDGTLEVSTSP